MGALPRRPEKVHQDPAKEEEESSKDFEPQPRMPHLEYRPQELDLIYPSLQVPEDCELENFAPRKRLPI